VGLRLGHVDWLCDSIRCHTGTLVNSNSDIDSRLYMAYEIVHDAMHFTNWHDLYLIVSIRWREGECSDAGDDQ
jgi:hypothetical protein